MLGVKEGELVGVVVMRLWVEVALILLVVSLMVLSVAVLLLLILEAALVVLPALDVLMPEAVVVALTLVLTPVKPSMAEPKWQLQHYLRRGRGRVYGRVYGRRVEKGVGFVLT